METGFPPRPTRLGQIEMMLNVFRTVVEGRQATYVSSPFTTGRQADEWIAKHAIGDPEDALLSERFKEHVLAANRQRAADFVRSLRGRASSASVVISPTALPDVPGWAQADYRFFWGRVIEEYAERVVFLDGWEHSSGCAYEYVCAARSGTTTLNELFRPLSCEEAVERLHHGAADSDAPGSGAFLRGAEAALRELIVTAGEAPR